MTEFNFWNRTLKVEEIHGLLQCSSNITGDIIKWTPDGIDDTLEAFGEPNLKEEDSDQWCRQREAQLSSQILVTKVPAMLALQHCSVFNGKLPVPNSDVQRDYQQITPNPSHNVNHGKDSHQC